jgi:osmotically-inducible protein OsmY
MNYKSNRLYFLLFTVIYLQACAAAIVTGGAVGVTAATSERTTGTLIEDQSIELKTSSEFRKHEDIKSQAHWSVTSYNTKVLLTGEAPTEEIRQKMGDAALTVDKVTHVYNEITIAAPSSMMSRSSDTLITGKVKTLLLADKNTKGLSVKVVTDKGVVHLMGLVSREQGDNTTEVARQTGGVQKVVKLFEYID